jgi:formate hydrogenlyase transcriptional activator
MRNIAFAMTNAHCDEQTTANRDQYLALLAVSEAIVSHRDLEALFSRLAEALHKVVRFDYLMLILHDAATDSMREHVLEPSDPTLLSSVQRAGLADDSPSPMVWETQEPFIVSDFAQLERWPRLAELAESVGIQSSCELPLTTARRRLGTLVFSCKELSAYDAANLCFLKLVANQAAVAVENALAFDEIKALKEELSKENADLEKEVAYLEEEVRTEHNFGEIVGKNAALREILNKVQTVAPTDSTVLVYGETGTGKELIARALHELSPRKGRTFVKLNCAAIPTGLLESELFGHEKGAFTGAITQKVGRFELANRGTLFLDEVGDIPPELQPKLLRVLQEQEFERLGSTKTIKVDVRLVAATNRDLAQMVAENKFRSDLYYRLNVFPLMLPPLRERADDIPGLVRHFTQRFARRMGRRIESIPTAVMDALVRYSWPGNVRELQNVIERAVILSKGSSLEVPLSDLESRVQRSEGGRAKSDGHRAEPSNPAASPDGAADGLTLAEAERQHILSALGDSHWVVGGPKGAAARLGMKRSTLVWKMKKLGLSRPE